MSKKMITAKDIVNKFNISFQTVNHYTNFGLLRVVTKQSNVRMYVEAEVKIRLEKIHKMISEGYPLRLIRDKLNGVV
ncbi:MerR family transcriptional regulator [Candidatus Omnitrophota bacterium]